MQKGKPPRAPPPLLSTLHTLLRIREHEKLYHCSLDHALPPDKQWYRVGKTRSLLGTVDQEPPENIRSVQETRALKVWPHPRTKSPRHNSKWRLP